MLHIQLDFAAGFITKDQAHRVADMTHGAIKAIMNNPDQTWCSIDYMAAGDLQRIWSWNSVVPSARQTCVHYMMKEQMKAQPDALAVSAWDGDFIYDDLHTFSMRLAQHLITLGIQPKTKVPLCFEKSKWTIVAMLAVLEVGAAFVLLDPSLPPSRQDHIISMTEATHLVCSPQQSTRCSQYEAITVVLDSDLFSNELRQQPNDNQLTSSTFVDPSWPMYVQFTSGSTGQPKGVVTNHAAFAAAVTHQAGALGYGKGVRAYDFTSYAFDPSIETYVMTLASGGCLCIPSDMEVKDYLTESLISRRADLVELTPSVARTLDRGKLSSLKTVVLGGEAAQQDDLEDWPEGVRVINTYGPSECTSTSVINLDESHHKATNIGVAVGAVSWVVDREDPNRLAPIGVTGELLLEGPIVGSGYLKDEKKTAETFVQDLSWLLRGGAGYSGRQGRLYKTGDLVRYDDDGSLVYVGRKDTQVKIRGQRVELGEVEYHLRQCLPGSPLVAAEVVVPSGETGSSILAAFVALKEDEDRKEHGASSAQFMMVSQETEDTLAQRLPAVMIPAVYFILPHMPLNASGKLDRHRLRAIGSSFSTQQLAEMRVKSSGDRRAPTTEAERKLQKIWARILNIDAAIISSNDSFFRLGGDSIAAMKVVSQARGDDLSLSVADIFHNPTISALAGISAISRDVVFGDIAPFSLLGKSLDEIDYRNSIATDCGIDQSQIRDAYPCTPLQEGLLALTLKSNGEAYVLRTVLKLAKDVDLHRFHETWKYLAKMIPILRTRIIQNQHLGPLQVVVDEAIPWDTGYNLDQYLKQSQSLSMSLGRPLARFAMIRDANSLQSSFVLTIHHALYDATSISQMWYLAGQLYYEKPFIDPIDFKVFVKYLTEIDPEASKAHWRAALADYTSEPFPPLQQPMEPRPRSIELRVNSLPPVQVSDVTVATTIQAAWALTVSASSGATDVVFGTTVSGRSARLLGIENIAGPTIATFPFRVKVDFTETIPRFLQQVQKQSIDVIPHEQFGLHHIQNLSDEAYLACQFQTLLVIQPREGEDASQLVNLGNWEEDARAEAFANYALNITCSLGDGDVHIEVLFDEAIIDRLSVQRLLERFDSVINQLAGGDDISLREIETLCQADYRDIWSWNNNVPSAIERCVHDIIEDQVKLRPSASAICAWDGVLTYAELDKLATKLAYYLTDLGVGQETMVALCFEKSKWIVVAMLAVLKAGGAFVPIDTSQAAHRRERILAQADATVILTSQQQEATIHRPGRTVLCIGADFFDANSELKTNAMMPRAEINRNEEAKCTDADSAAYVFFTSGSTGSPKGVIVEHRAVSSSCTYHGQEIGFTPSSRVFQFASYVFDACIMEIFTTLIYGGCICIPSDYDRLNNLESSIAAMEANIAFFTPTVSRSLSPSRLPSLLTVVTGGERVDDADLARWGQHRKCLNGYGPTECTVFCVMNIADKPHPGSGSTIGRAVGSVSWVCMTDDHNRLAPVGTVGELLIEGPITARHYVHDQRSTESAFVQDPAWLVQGGAGYPGRRGRLYKTGDLVKYDKEGRLIYLGRKDAQVKIRGQRVELGEVEHHVRECIPGALMIAAELIIPSGENASPVLAAFVAMQQNDDSNGPDSELANVMKPPLDLHDALLQRLPTYMIPAVYFAVPKMPLNSSGKINRRQLHSIGSTFSAQKLAELQAVTGRGKRQPATTTERALQRIWARILNVDLITIGVDDSFFHLGGDSVAAMKVVSLARGDGLSLSVADIFRYPTINVLARSTSQILNDAIDDEIQPFSLLCSGLEIESIKSIAVDCGVDLAQIQDAYPCTALQEGLLSLTSKSTGEAYISRTILDLDGEVDLERFRNVWTQLSLQLPILRTKLVQTRRFGLLQVIFDEAIPWHASNNLNEYLNLDRASPMGLGSRLTRFGLVHEAGASRSSFVLTIHHALYDGHFLSRLLDSANRKYRGELPLNFLDFSLYMKHSAKARSAAADAYWRAYLDGFESPTFPILTTGAEPAAKSVEIRTHPLPRISGANVTIANVIRAAWALTLAKSSGVSDVVFGTTVSGRSASFQGIEHIAGPTISTVPVRVSVDRHKSVSSFLQEVQQQSIEMIPYEQTGLSHIQTLSPQANQACRFQTWLIIQPTEDNPEVASNSNIANIRDASEESAFSTYALNLTCSYTQRNITVQADFDEKFISRWQMKLILDRFSYILDKLSPSHYDKPLSQLEMLSTDEYNQLWAMNGTVPRVNNRCIHQIIKDQALVTPHKPAICAWDGEVTYAELEESATKLSHELLLEGIGHGDIIPICFEKSRLTAIAMLAVIKAGSAFVLLDPSHPTSRLQDIISQVGARLLLCSVEQQATSCADLIVRKIPIDSGILLNPAAGSDVTIPSAALPDVSSPLYIVFTSGSTGRPKGVKVSHGAFSSAFYYQSERLGFSSSQRVYDVSSYAFDIAVSTPLMTFASGGCLCVPSDRERKDKLTESFIAFNATMIHTTPSIFRFFDRHQLSSLQFLLSAGEPPRKDDFTGWPTTTRIINTYGPAECTPTSTININAGVGAEKLSTNIGFGTGVVTWVVDPQDSNRLMPIGTVGELVLEGPLVGLGYLNEPQITTASFIEDPSWLLRGGAGHPGRRGRLYKTGDLVRYEEDGSLMYIERKDVQVKIRGQRVELGEVEHHVRQCVPEIEEVAATVISPGGDGVKLMLAAFMVMQSTPPSDVDTNSVIRAEVVIVDDTVDEALTARLPTYMVPNVYFALNRLPMNATGKTDRRKLNEIGSNFTAAQIAELSSTPQARKRMPSTETEQALQRIWAQFLNLDATSIGVDDSFFRLGGDSITAMLVSSAVREQLGDISTADILARKTIASVSQKVDDSRTSWDQEFGSRAVGVTDPLFPYGDLNNIQDSDMTRLGISSKHEVEDIYPCSPMQSHMLKAQAEDSRIYRMIHEFEISDIGNSASIRDASIAHAWQAVVQQHTLLRAKLLRRTQGRRMTAMQVILKNPAMNISFHEADSHDSIPTREVWTAPSYDEDSLQHHLSVYRISSDRVFIRLEINHAIMDGYSINIMFRDFQAALENRLKPSSASFRDFIKYVEAFPWEASREFWTEKLMSMKSCHFPTLETHHHLQGTEYVEVPGLEDIDIHVYCAERELTLATVIQTVWAIVLYELTGGQENLCFGTIMSCRDAPIRKITEIFGPVMCLVPTHVRLDKGLSILETMTDIHNEYIDKLPHQMYPVMDLYEEVCHNSQVLFNSALSIVRTDASEPPNGGDGVLFRHHDGRDPVEV